MLFNAVRTISVLSGKDFVFACALCFSAWMAFHPNGGVWHDGELYLAQALFHLKPEVFGEDLFFKYGSQDKYTILSPFYAWVIDLIGVSQASLSLWLLNQLAFVIGVYLCARELFGRQFAIWTVFSVAMMSPFYGSDNIFSYAEGFFTARNAAEPFCLFAIYAILKGRHWQSLVLLSFALLLHPLPVLSCLLVWWLCRVQLQFKYIWLGLFAPIFFVLALSDVAPFNALVKQYDSYWWDLIQLRTPFVILSNWDFPEVALLIVDFSLVCLASSAVEKRGRRLLLAVLVVAVVSMCAAFLGTIIFHNQLITSLQVWRAQWVLHLVAMMAIPYLFVRFSEMAGYAIYGLQFFALSLFLYPDVEFLYVVGFSCLLTFMHLLKMQPSELTRRLLRATAVSFILLLAVMLVAQAHDAAFGQRIITPTDAQRFEAFFYFPLFLKMALMGVVVCYFYLHIRWGAVFLLAVLTALLLTHWDQRSPWQRYVVEAHPAPHPFLKYIKPGSDVYWYGELMPVWLLLGHSSYYSSKQGSGLLFNRGTAEEYSKRTALLGFDDDVCFKERNLRISDQCRPTESVVRDVCDREKKLSAMIFPFPVNGLPSYRWEFMPTKKSSPLSFYLYACHELVSLPGVGVKNE